MKYNVIRLFLLFFAVLFFSACEDNRMDGMVNDKVYLLQSGLQKVPVNYRDYADIYLTMYKSGVGDRKAKVTFEISQDLLTEYNEKNKTAYELLPEICFEFENRECLFAKDDIDKNLMITFDGAIIKRFQNLYETKYALPVKAIIEGDVDVDKEKTTVIILPILEK